MGSVEGLLQVQTGKLIYLSAQELVDCDSRNIAAATIKEQVETAFRYIRRVGVTTQHCFPYRGFYIRKLEVSINISYYYLLLFVVINLIKYLKII